MGNKGTAIVTGAARGIGRILVETFVAQGYFVEFTYMSSHEDARALEKLCNGRCRGKKVDGSSPDEVAHYIRDIYRERSSISILVNNAGITRDSLIKDANWTDYRNTLNTNFGGVFNYCHWVLPLMMRQRVGDIINISSLAAGNIRPGNALYGTAKCAVERFTRSLALEAIRFNVVANTIAPGFVETDLTKEMLHDPKRKRTLLREIPMKRLTRLEEVAQAAVFLTSRNPMLVGVTIPLGGGGHLR